MQLKGIDSGSEGEKEKERGLGRKEKGETEGREVEEQGKWKER